MKVSELPPGRLVSVGPESTLAEVARLMRVDDSDSVAVISDGRLIGIVTEHDLVRAMADGVNPKKAKAGQLMSTDPVTVGVDEDVAVVAVKMMRLDIRHLPVVDSAGEPIGLVSARNLVTALDRSTN